LVKGGEYLSKRNFTDENKFEFLEWFIGDDDLCKALINKEKNFLDISITQEQKDSLIFNQIFPYKFIPDITISANGYLFFTFNYEYSRTNQLFLISDINVWCFCHRDLIRTQYKYLRYDFMKQRVSEMLQDKTDNNWFWKMKLYSSREMSIDESATYYGVQLNFRNEILK